MIEIGYLGKIHFEPEHVTKKHEIQGEWKKTAMILIDGEISEYYAWFFFKHYGLKFIKPLRGAHVTFINDRLTDIQGETEENKIALWNQIKEKYEGKDIIVNLNLIPRSDSKHWWFNISEEHRVELQEIRNELGLGRPYFGMHMTIGKCNEKNIDLSDYVRRLLIFQSNQI